MNIVFFGSSSYVLPILEVLRKNFNLSLVVTTEKPLASQGVPLRSYLRSYAGVIEYCQKNKIPYISLKQFNNSTIQQLIKAKVQVAVLADFGLIIPPEILNLFPKGILNIHPSLLPKYRGPSPVQTAILNNDKTTGATIIKLDKEVDHGPILAQKEEGILENDTSQTLYERLFKIGAKLLKQNIHKYIKGQLKLSEQNHAKATFTKLLTRQDGYIEISKIKNLRQRRIRLWRKKSKTELERMIKAYFPWPSVWTKWKMKNDKWKILKFLPNKKIQVEGKKPISYKDFLNGYPDAKEIRILLKDL